MLHPTHKIGLAVILCGLLLVPNAMWGQKGKARPVQDEAKLFGDKAIEEANSIIAKIKDKHQKDLVIDTVDKGVDKAAATKWAEKRFAETGLDGVYIVISKEPKHFEIVIGSKTGEKGYFTNAHRDEVKSLLAKNLKDNRDEALLKVANYTLKVMDKAASKNAPRLVKDDAKLFSEDALKDANTIIAKLREQFQKDLVIETMDKGPDAKDLGLWARERSKKLGVDGVYIIISTDPKRFQVEVGEETRKLFTASDLKEVVQMLRGLGKNRDETLLRVANYVHEAISQRKKADEK